MKNSTSLEEVQSIIQDNEMVLTYFTTTDCNLCKDLFPKIEKMLEEFPQVIGVRSEIDSNLEFVGAYSVYTVPTIILFVQGKETIRRSRQIGIGEFSDAMSRYYQMLFE
ncbi:MAG: thioredoxin family protein [Clostridia bacterium]|nr:thioredoxin family protein [Clostridia bacterium]